MPIHPDTLRATLGWPLMLSGRVFDQRRALGQNGDALGQAEHHVHVVFDDGDGDVALVADLLQQVDGVVGIGPRHPGGGFVQQQKPRVLAPGTCRFPAAACRRATSRPHSCAACRHVQAFQHAFGLFD